MAEMVPKVMERKEGRRDTFRDRKIHLFAKLNPNKFNAQRIEQEEGEIKKIRKKNTHKAK